MKTFALHLVKRTRTVNHHNIAILSIRFVLPNVLTIRVNEPNMFRVVFGKLLSKHFADFLNNPFPIKGSTVGVFYFIPPAI